MPTVPELTLLERLCADPLLESWEAAVGTVFADTEYSPSEVAKGEGVGNTEDSTNNVTVAPQPPRDAVNPAE